MVICWMFIEYKILCLSLQSDKVKKRCIRKTRPWMTGVWGVIAVTTLVQIRRHNRGVTESP